MNKLAIGLVGLAVGLGIGATDRAWNPRELTAAVQDLQGRVGALEQARTVAQAATLPPGQRVYGGLVVEKLPGIQSVVTPNGTEIVVFNVKVRNVGTAAVTGRLLLVARDKDGDPVETIEYQHVNPMGSMEMEIRLKPGQAAAFTPNVHAINYSRITDIEPVVK